MEAEKRDPGIEVGTSFDGHVNVFSFQLSRIKARHNYAKLHYVDLFACLRVRRQFPHELSLGPGGTF